MFHNQILVYLLVNNIKVYCFSLKKTNKKFTNIWEERERERERERDDDDDDDDDDEPRNKEISLYLKKKVKLIIYFVILFYFLIVWHSNNNNNKCTWFNVIKKWTVHFNDDQNE